MMRSCTWIDGRSAALWLHAREVRSIGVLISAVRLGCGIDLVRFIGVIRRTNEAGRIDLLKNHHTSTTYTTS